MERKHRRSIFFPLLLITLGAIFLLNTMGILPGNVWDLLVKLWPLLFIIGGLDNIFQGQGWVRAILSLGFGTVFLMANFGYLPADAFSMLLRLWPLLIIGAGLDILFQDRSPLTTVLGIVIALGIVGGIFWFVYNQGVVVKAAAEPISQPLEGAERANVRLANPVGSLKLASGAEADVLLDGSVVLGRGQSLNQRYDLKDGLGSFDLSMENTGAVFFPWSGGLNAPLWDFRLNSQVPSSLIVNTGAGEQELDLTGLNLDSINISLAVGALEIVLPVDDALYGEISNPIGSVRLEIPRDALVEIRAETAIVGRSLPDGYRLDGQYIYSPGADSTNAQIRLTLDHAIGVLQLVEIP